MYGSTGIRDSERIKLEQNEVFDIPDCINKINTINPIDPNGTFPSEDVWLFLFILFKISLKKEK
jgi:hypothetical protein